MVTETYIDGLNFVCKKKKHEKKNLIKFLVILHWFIYLSTCNYKFTEHHLIAIHLIS